MKRDWRMGLERQVGCRVRRNEPLSRHTTLGVGGNSEILAWIDDEEKLMAAWRFLTLQRIDWRVIGNGSNLLVADSGVPGATLKLWGSLNGMRVLEERKREWLLEAGGGASLHRLIQFALARGASGLECLMGIPGTVGGAVKGNAGTRKGTVADHLKEVRLFYRGTARWVPAQSLQLGYRSSMVGPHQVVVGARFCLPRRDPLALRERLASFQQKRWATQPRGVRSAGCFFKNPPLAPAGYLIEQAGCKGAYQGHAFVSRQHANFIVHQGGSSASEIYALSRYVQSRVKKAYGVNLEREVELWGKFQPVRKRRRTK